MGFGDAVSPEPIEIDFPTMLPMAGPKLRAYRRETVVAEKLHAMVDLGIANSRMKDFFDIWFLSQNFDFDGTVLAEAIKATFAKRKTRMPTEMPFALTEAFSKDEAKQKQWKAFSSRMSKGASVAPLDELVAVISPFLWPPLEALHSGALFERTWKALGPWA